MPAGRRRYKVAASRLRSIAHLLAGIFTVPQQGFDFSGFVAPEIDFHVQLAIEERFFAERFERQVVASRSAQIKILAMCANIEQELGIHLVSSGVIFWFRV